MADVPLDGDRPARHLRTDPVTGVARDDDVPAAHRGPEVHAGVALDHDAAAGHPGPDHLHSRGVAADAQLAIGLTGDATAVAGRRLLMAVQHRDRSDLRRGHPLEALRFERSASKGTSGSVCKVRVRLMSVASSVFPAWAG